MSKALKSFLSIYFRKFNLMKNSQLSLCMNCILNWIIDFRIHASKVIILFLKKKYVNHDKIYGISFSSSRVNENENEITKSRWARSFMEKFFFIIKLHFGNFESCGKQKLRTSINLIWFSPLLLTNLVIFPRRFFLLCFQLRNSWKAQDVNQKLCNQFYL